MLSSGAKIFKLELFFEKINNAVIYGSSRRARVQHFSAHSLFKVNIISIRIKSKPVIKDFLVHVYMLATTKKIYKTWVALGFTLKTLPIVVPRAAWPPNRRSLGTRTKSSFSGSDGSEGQVISVSINGVLLLFSVYFFHSVGSSIKTKSIGVPKGTDKPQAVFKISSKITTKNRDSRSCCVPSGLISAVVKCGLN